MDYFLALSVEVAVQGSQLGNKVRQKRRENVDWLNNFVILLTSYK